MACCGGRLCGRAKNPAARPARESVRRACLHRAYLCIAQASPSLMESRNKVCCVIGFVDAHGS